jgi:hypothetical protein
MTAVTAPGCDLAIAHEIDWLPIDPTAWLPTPTPQPLTSRNDDLGLNTVTIFRCRHFADALAQLDQYLENTHEPKDQH